jgi:hypothetical protein
MMSLMRSVIGMRRCAAILLIYSLSSRERRKMKNGLDINVLHRKTRDCYCLTGANPIFCGLRQIILPN